jgi:hypothetical protein
MPKKKSSSMDELAAVTQQRFLAVGQRLDRFDHKVDAGFAAVTDVLALTRADLHDVKSALGPLVRTVASLEETVRHLDKRVARLEQRANLK